MDLTAAQHQTLEELAEAEENGRTRIVVTGSDPRTGVLHLRAQEEIKLLPNGLTAEHA
jgi:hypothetical protein